MEETLRHYYLGQLGVQRWVLRDSEPTKNSTGQPIADVWADLSAEVAACTACPLHQTRTQTVFGVGNRHADLLLVGEAPGFHEDQQGEPFVGRAGQLLTTILQSIGLQRDDVYIANVLKCRPPDNRDPQQEEVTTCTPFLLRQVELIQPKMIVALGRYAAHFLLETKASLASLRQKTHTFRDTGIPLIVTYHPAYLLRNSIDKRKAYQDWQQVARHCERSAAIQQV